MQTCQLGLAAYAMAGSEHLEISDDTSYQYRSKKGAEQVPCRKELLIELKEEFENMHLHVYYIFHSNA